jgi:tRNA pseudouridine38-40 synthase
VARLAVGIEYDGGNYHGWQTQPSAASVQSCVEQALASIAAQPVALICAGRTDAGVHAAGQVAHFDTTAQRPLHAWLMGGNAALPPDISLRWVAEVPEQFHARFSALSRCYRYWILNHHTRSALAAGRALCVYQPLDEAAMQAALQLLLGEHDFSAFRAAECQARSPVRRLLQAQVTRHGPWLCVQMRANAFLQHMVRNIVGLLLAVGRGDRPPAHARVLLESKDRRLGEATMPAHGLYLWQVEYARQFGLPEDSAMIDALLPEPSSRRMND